MLPQNPGGGEGIKHTELIDGYDILFGQPVHPDQTRYAFVLGWWCKENTGGLC